MKYFDEYTPVKLLCENFLKLLLNIWLPIENSTLNQLCNEIQLKIMCVHAFIET